jgi:hypothetical protein
VTRQKHLSLREVFHVGIQYEFNSKNIYVFKTRMSLSLTFSSMFFLSLTPNLTKSNCVKYRKKYRLTYTKVQVNDEAFSPVRLESLRYERRLAMLGLR